MKTLHCPNDRTKIPHGEVFCPRCGEEVGEDPVKKDRKFRIPLSENGLKGRRKRKHRIRKTETTD